ncbi:MAG: sulfotransferase [Phycisphaerae bacterium]|nr:sulfotransferase [Phycisphaerae bacterium]
MPDITIDIPDDIRALRPIFVYPPAERCGSTFVQRLLNSCGEMICYASDWYLRSLIERTYELVSDRHGITRSMEVFLSGNTETWSNAVLPKPGEYIDYTVDVLFDLLRRYRQWSEDVGFQRWGFKCVAVPAEQIERTLTFIPNARIIWLYRNIYDVARSAKARQFTKDIHDLRTWAREWTRSMLWVHEHKYDEHPNVLMLRYEDLTEDRQASVDRIEGFCGIEGVRLDVFERKINAPTGTKRFGDFPTGYVPPAGLDEAECDMIEEEAAGALALYDYPIERGALSAAG